MWVRMKNLNIYINYITDSYIAVLRKNGRTGNKVKKNLSILSFINNLYNNSSYFIDVKDEIVLTDRFNKTTKIISKILQEIADCMCFVLSSPNFSNIFYDVQKMPKYMYLTEIYDPGCSSVVVMDVDEIHYQDSFYLTITPSTANYSIEINGVVIPLVSGVPYLVDNVNYITNIKITVTT